jgi:hypothetical protein
MSTKSRIEKLEEQQQPDMIHLVVTQDADNPDLYHSQPDHKPYTRAEIEALPDNYSVTIIYRRRDSIPHRATIAIPDNGRD